MSAEKISSDEVPQKLIEWLLAMGYPQENIPSLDTVSQKCRGQYYMVWRSLMEHVRPKHEIREKRLNVFCDDVQQFQKKNIFNERDSNVVIPEQLELWQQQKDIQKKVIKAEAHVSQARQDLKQLLDKVSSRISQRDISRRKVEDKQRRVWLLRQVAAELTMRKANLEETRDIAISLCAVSGDDDLQSKVDKCLTLLRKPSQPSASLSLLSNPAASSSVMSSAGDDTEEQLCSLARSHGDSLWTLLCERRAALHGALVQANTLHVTTQIAKDHRSTTQSVLAHTASLHCILALETMKNRARIKHTRARFAVYLEDLNDYLNGVACELLVLRCERANADARVHSLRTLLEELTARTGVFEVAGERNEPVNGKQISAVDKTIETSRDELKRLLVSLTATERRIHSTKEALTSVFNSFHCDSPIDRYKGVQLNFPQEPISSICKFYEQERDKRRNKADLSMDFDTSDCSLNNTIDSTNPRFTDELRFYIKKFDLEKNQKLVMESGDKIWIFETLQASLGRLNSRWLSNNIPPLLCPSTTLSCSLKKIFTDIQTKGRLENTVKNLLGCDRKLTFDMDLTERKAEDETIVDMQKKRIGENLHSLQKCVKLLEVSQKNLQLWQDDQIKKCISSNRTVDGKSYEDYEAIYKEGLSLYTNYTK